MCPRKSSVPWFPGVVSLVVGLMTISCAKFGPNKLQSSHLNYNKAVQKAQMEEDLLNIVRLRYLDMPVSLTVSSISAQASFSVGSGGEFGLVEDEPSANITPFIGYTDRPTITFTPYSGQEFLESIELLRIPREGGPVVSTGIVASRLSRPRISSDGSTLAFDTGQRRAEVWSIDHLLAQLEPEAADR